MPLPKKPCFDICCTHIPAALGKKPDPMTILDCLQPAAAMCLDRCMGPWGSAWAFG